MGVFETAISAARRRKAKNPAERLATDVLISVTDDSPFFNWNTAFRCVYLHRNHGQHLIFFNWNTADAKSEGI